MPAFPLLFSLVVVVASSPAFASLMDLPLPESKTLATFHLKTADVGPYRFQYVAAKWQPVLDQLKASGALQQFFDYVRREHGFEYRPRAGTKDSTLIQGILLPDAGSLAAQMAGGGGAGSMELAALVGGYASGSYITARLDPSYDPSRFPKAEEKKRHIQGMVIPIILHETVHLLSIRKIDEVLKKRRDPEAEVSLHHFGTGWFFEGLAENIPMAVLPEARSARYRAFYAMFIDAKRKPAFKDLIDISSAQNLPYLYAAGSMMVERMRLKWGARKIQSFFEDFAVNMEKTPFEKAFEKTFGLTEAAFWDDTYRHFEEKRAEYADVMK